MQTIIHVVPGISIEAAGPSYSVTRLCDSLIGNGCDVTLATLDPEQATSRPAYLRTFPLGVGPRRIGRSPRMARWLQLQARSGCARVIHNHSLWMMPNVYPGRVAKRYDISYVVSPRGTLSEWAMKSGSRVKALFWPLVQRPSLEAVSCWHATSVDEYRDIRRLGFRQPVAIIPNGVDVPDLPAKPQSATRTLLFLGRIHRQKGLELLLPAWRAVQDRFRDWELVIVGPDSGGYLFRLQRLAKEMRLQRTRFVGPLYGMSKWMAYRDADLFVLPTYTENFGMAIAEALGAGTPAITTKGAPWEGLLKHQAGWWIDISVDALVAALEEALATSGDVLQSMGERGRAWMISEFDWNAIAEQVAQCYGWLLGTIDKPSCIRDT